ncbi:hypothetical protein [Hydrogenimonas sp.]
MKKSTLFLLVSLSVANALEVRYGKSQFGWEMGIDNLMHCDFDLDTSTLSFVNTHDNFGNSDFYFFYDMDFYKSDTVDEMTSMLSTPLTTSIPFYGTSINDMAGEFVPVPSDYKIRGFDMNMGVGYDIYHAKGTYLGIGVNTGGSMPVMKMENLKLQDFVDFYNLLEDTETKIYTYKIGMSLQGNIDLGHGFSVYGSGEYNYQTGHIDNDWFHSSIDIDGTSWMVDMGVRYTLQKYLEGLFLSAGYTYKNWSVDKESVEVEMEVPQLGTMGMTMVNSMFDVDFHHEVYYFGVGYSF